MSNITPNEWLKLSLDNISEFQNGFAFKSGWFEKEGHFQVLKLGNIKIGELLLSASPAYVTKDVGEQYIRYKPDIGDILITMTGTKFKEDYGYVCRIKSSSNILINQRVGRIRPNKIIVESRYLISFMMSIKFRNNFFEGETGGVNQGNVGSKHILGCEVPIAPLAEQKEIANQLDSLLAKVDSIKSRLDAIPDIVKRFRQSIITSASIGKLTEEWRKQLSISPWEALELKDLILESANGLSKRSGTKGDDVTILRLADFKNAVRVTGKERQIKLEDKEQKKYGLAEGDILIIRVNGSVDLAGRFIEYKKEDLLEGFCDHFIRLRLDKERLLPKYLTYIANEGGGREYLQNSLSTSAGQNTINQGSVKGLKIQLPSIEEQAEIVCRVENLFDFANKVEQRVNAAQERVNSLTQSILAKAFRGELTTEWRELNQALITGENSAEALLAKIKAEREALSKKKSPKKKPVKQQMTARKAQD